MYIREKRVQKRENEFKTNAQIHNAQSSGLRFNPGGNFPQVGGQFSSFHFGANTLSANTN